MNQVKDRIRSVDPRPKDRSKWVQKFRKVVPPELGNSKVIQKESNGTRNFSSTSLAPYQGDWGAPQVMHLLRRSLFGVKRGELQQFLGYTASEAVDVLLQPADVPEPPKNYYNDPAQGIIDPHTAFGETWIEQPYSNEYEGRRIVSLKSWLIANMVNQQANLTERMIMFWHNLLPTQSWSIFLAKTSYQYFNMLRTHAFGNFKTLIRDLTLDAAMLIYLNGTRNNKEAPDENYARELQELFCIGKGPNANFSEEDVQAAARVLTGWVVNWNQITSASKVDSFFWQDIHDTGDKQFSAFYGNRVIIGRSGSQGAEELDELFDMIFENSETALYLSRRLYQFFVYPEISPQVEADVIEPMADLLRSENYEVKPVLELLLKSQHFFDVQHYGAQIKSPVDYLAGLWRSLEMTISDPSDHVLNDQLHRSMLWNMATKGQEIADPPSVSGWPAYYQTPQFDKAWITTDTVSSRAVTGDALIYWGFWINQQEQLPADLVKFVEGFAQPEDPNQLLADLTQLLLGIQLAEEELIDLKTVLLSGQREDYYWTQAWYDYVNNPGSGNFRLTVDSRLKSLFQRLFQRGEFQLL